MTSENAIIVSPLLTTNSTLSRHLGHVPVLPGTLTESQMRELRLSFEADAEPMLATIDSNCFAARILHLRLANFWRVHSPVVGSKYDPIPAQQSYDTFCTEFLPTIPAIFALQPDTRWDERQPLLARQRQLFHVAVFEWLCYKFRPILFEERNHIENLPVYKKVLVMSQKRGLAAAALYLLEGVSSLHILIGGSHTRFPGVIAPAFEAAVLLLCLCADPNFPEYESDVSAEVSLATNQTHPLQVREATVTRDECMQAVRQALARLKTLAVISDMAEVGARNVSRLLENLERTNSLSGAGGISTIASESAMHLQAGWNQLEMPGYVEIDPLSGAVSNAGPVAFLNWGDMAGTWAGNVQLS